MRSMGRAVLTFCSGMGEAVPLGRLRLLRCLREGRGCVLTWKRHCGCACACQDAAEGQPDCTGLWAQTGYDPYKSCETHPCARASQAGGWQQV